MFFSNTLDFHILKTAKKQAELLSFVYVDDYLTTT